MEKHHKSLRTCRTCWEKEEDEGLLCQPCQCTGTQRYVHIKCLRRWQECLQKIDPADERAYRCSVCCTRFSLPPPRPRWSARLLHAARGLGGAACISLLAFGLSGPPWPHLALLVLLLLGTRSHSLLAVGLLLVASVLAALHAKGLKVVMRVDGAGRLGLALVRHGPPVEGIGPGTLLVASEDLDGTMFRRSAVLLTHHSRLRGARGVILTQAMSAAPQLPALADAQAEAAARALLGAARGVSGAGNDTAAGGLLGRRAGRRAAAGSASPASQAERRQPVLRHHIGGPVGMPGEGMRQEMVLLHNVHGVPGSTRLLPLPLLGAAAGAAAAPNTTARTAAAASPAAQHLQQQQQPQQPHGHLGGLRLFEGGALADVLELASLQLGGRQPPTVLVFHGVCAWADGQLEGEVRSGHWGFTPAMLDDVLPPQPNGRLWQTLMHTDRLTWMPA